MRPVKIAGFTYRATCAIIGRAGSLRLSRPLERKSYWWRSNSFEIRSNMSFELAKTMRRNGRSDSL